MHANYLHCLVLPAQCMLSTCIFGLCLNNACALSAFFSLCLHHVCALPAFFVSACTMYALYLHLLVSAFTMSALARLLTTCLLLTACSTTIPCLPNVHRPVPDCVLPTHCLPIACFMPSYWLLSVCCLTTKTSMHAVKPRHEQNQEQTGQGLYV